jgi:hypothetical protein
MRIACPPRGRQRPAGLAAGGANIRHGLAVYRHRLRRARFRARLAAWWASLIRPLQRPRQSVGTRKYLTGLAGGASET